jgi:polysaccharide transporter, PST family
MIPGANALPLRRLFAGAFSIFVIQLVNFGVPLVALPFIVRALGIDLFAQYVALLVWGAYLVLVADYSWNQAGALRLSGATESRIAQIILDALTAKIILCLPLSAAYLVVTGLIIGIRVDLTCLGLLNALALTLTPRWVAYALGQIRQFAVASVTTRLLWLVVVVLFVAGESDLVLLLIVTFCTQVCALIWSVALVWPRQTSARWRWRRGLNLLREDVRVFRGVLASSSLRDGSLAVLALLATPVQVSSFAVADRLRLALVGLFAPLNQALFHMQAADRTDTALRHLRGRLNAAVVLLAAMGGVAVFLAAEPLVSILGGPGLEQAAPIARILSVLPIATALSQAMGFNTLLVEADGREQLAQAQSWSAIAGWPITIVLIVGWGATGAATAAVLAEVLFCAYLYRALARAGLLGAIFKF